MQRRTCSRPDCSERVAGRKLCRKHYQAAWKAGTFVNEPLKPRTRARTVCHPEHKHGASSTCYIQHQCRCDACRDAHTIMERRRHREKAYGRFDTGLVPAEPIRQHMLLLAQFGIGYKRAAALAGIGTTAARNLIWGRQEPGPRYGELQKRVKRETAEALLRVKPTIENMSAGAVIPARGAHRRVQALAAIGWSLSRQATYLGENVTNFIRSLETETITVRRHRAIAVMFDELWAAAPVPETWRARGGITRTIRHAKARRWLPPLAWDDIDNDVEPPVPDEISGGVDEMAIELALSGDRVRLTPLERREAVSRLVAVKLNDVAIAERLHIADRTVLRIRQELGLAAPIGADKQVVA